MKSKILVLGAGFAGAVVSDLLSKKYEVTVVDASNTWGGGNLTSFYGGHPYTFGPRVFFSRQDEIISYLTSRIKLRSLVVRSKTYVERIGQFLSYPLLRDELFSVSDYRDSLNENAGISLNAKNFEDYWIHHLGSVLYNDVVNNYSKKMWGIESNVQLGTSWDWVNKGNPVRSDGDDRLYGDQFQGYPENLSGYNPYFELAFSNSNLRLGSRVRFLDVDNRVVILESGERLCYDNVIVSIPVDEVFNYRFGQLKYSGRTFTPLLLPVSRALPDAVSWIHYPGNESYTRVTEFKKITGYTSEQTLLGIEFPSSKGRYYPVQSEVELTRYSKYTADLPDSVFFVGRHGTFRYKGIPDVIEDGLNVAKKILS